MKIYLSSTSIDLENHRKAVIDGLRIAGHIVVCMEDYPANDVIPVDKCLADVAECELYVGILAWRYGFIPEGSDLSITEQEYRQAQENKIPSLIFIAEDSQEWPIEYRDTGDSLSKLQNLKDETTKQKIVRFFNIPQHLSTLVLASVQHVERNIAYTQRAVMNVEEEKAIMLAMIKEQMIKLENQNKQMTREPIPIRIPKLNEAFMDREVPRDTLHHWLRFDNKQLVAIVAPGGFGKTDLTTKMLHEIVSIPNIIDNEIHGILYLTCRDAGEVAGITLGHIFIQAGRIAGKQDAFQQTYANNNISLQRKLEYLFNELSQVGNIWVVMDNFEDLLDAKTDFICDVEINAFMEAACVSDYSVRIIITTRAIPKFEGSRNFALLDLSQGLPEDYAIQYLREVGGDCGIKDVDEELLRAFVNRVYGIPKALESVIGYLKDRSPEITLKHLMDDKSYFADFDAHDSEKGLKKLIAKQFEKQSTDSQLILCALSIFPHPVLIETLRFLLPNFTLPVFAEIIRRLIRNHLINEERGYYDMHPIVRSYIYNQLQLDDDLIKADFSGSNINRLTCKGLHTVAAEFYYGQVKMLKIDRSISNTTVICENWNKLDQKYYVECIDEAIYHIIKSCVWNNLSTIHDDILMVYRIKADSGDSVYKRLSFCKQMIQIFNDANIKRLEMDWIHETAIVYYIMGQYIEAEQYCNQGIVLAQNNNDSKIQGALLHRLAIIKKEMGNNSEARKIMKQAATVKETCCNKREVAETLAAYAELLIDEGYFEKSIEILKYCTEVESNYYMKAGEINSAGISSIKRMLSLSLNYFYILKEEEGNKLINECIELTNVNGFSLALVRSILVLSSYLIINNKINEAITQLKIAYDIAYKANHALFSAETSLILGYAYQISGDFDSSMKWYSESTIHNIARLSGNIKVFTGICYLHKNDTIKANEYFNEAVGFFRDRLSKSPKLFKYQYLLALTFAAMGKINESIDIYNEALKCSSAPGVIKQAILDLTLLESAIPDSHKFANIKILLENALKVVK